MTGNPGTTGGPDVPVPDVPVPDVPVPDVFGRLAGQEQVVAQLRAAAAAGPGGTGHAWLFTGPPGSGRSTAARAFAAAVLCENGGCGHCPSCRQVAAGTHADLLLVQPDGLSYGVKQTRDLVLRAATAPVYGRFRVVLFEDADRATEQAANALLKAIEEPAPRTIWLLCAPSAADLPVTIRSRCRLVTLRIPPAQAVAEVLAAEGVPQDQALLAARAAQGHIGRARRLATDPDAAARRAEVLRLPSRATSLGPALAAAASLVKAAEAEAAAVSEELDVPEREALRKAFGEGSTGNLGVSTPIVTMVSSHGCPTSDDLGQDALRARSWPGSDQVTGIVGGRDRDAGATRQVVGSSSASHSVGQPPRPAAPPILTESHSGNGVRNHLGARECQSSGVEAFLCRAARPNDAWDRCLWIDWRTHKPCRYLSDSGTGYTVLIDFERMFDCANGGGSAALIHGGLMAKARTKFVCQHCGLESPAMYGRCPECGAWNSMVETIEAQPGRSERPVRGKGASLHIVPLESVVSAEDQRQVIPISELNRVLGGGLVPGSLVLVGGDPGIGKSTLLLQAASMLAHSAPPVLYVSAEESAQQVRLRADRLGLGTQGLFVLSETRLDDVLAAAEELNPSLLIVDSIQTVYLDDLTSAAGSVSQVRECTSRIMQFAKPRQLPVFLVGHVTKEGAIAGPRVLEHMVDAVVYLEGDRFHQFRILRAVKNRFGSTDEVGVFEMADAGMREVLNPSEVFLQERAGNSAGSAIAVTMEGTRPILLEVQALTANSALGMPRRSANGFDSNRVQMLVAVLSKRVGLPLGGQDIYVNIVGGFTGSSSLQSISR